MNFICGFIAVGIFFIGLISGVRIQKKIQQGEENEVEKETTGDRTP